MTKKGSKKQTTAKTNGSPVTALSLAFVVGFHSPFAVNGFALTTTNPSSSYSLLFCQERQVIDRRRRRQRFLVELFSFVGDGGSDRPPPPGGGGKGGGGENRKSWDDFLNREGEETENLIKAREYMSENSLPISYGLSNTEEEESKGENGNVLSDKTSISRTGDSDEASSSALVANNIVPGGDPTLSPDMLSSNPYMAVVSKLSPSDLISKFTSTAHPRVQNAVRATILGLIGGLPKMAFDTSTITTGQKLASLMFQLQMTGYMFKVIRKTHQCVQNWVQCLP